MSPGLVCLCVLPYFCWNGDILVITLAGHTIGGAPILVCATCVRANQERHEQDLYDVSALSFDGTLKGFVKIHSTLLSSLRTLGFIPAVG